MIESKHHKQEETALNLFDIVGPVMVGPSSSHTAGAVKIGYVARKLLQEPIAQAEIAALAGGDFGGQVDDLRGYRRTENHEVCVRVPAALALRWRPG